jgi:hypothetical protein
MPQCFPVASIEVRDPWYKGAVRGKSDDVHDLSQRRDDGGGNTILCRHGVDIPPTSLPVCAAEEERGLVFMHSTWHEGAVVCSGNKYVLGINVMYKQVSKR